MDENDGEEAMRRKDEPNRESDEVREQAGKKDKVDDDAEIEEEGQDNDEVYEVENIVTHDYNEDGELMYFVHWKGYGDEHDDWVREADMLCDELIKEYQDRLAHSNARKRETHDEEPDDEPPKKVPRRNRKRPSRERDSQGNSEEPKMEMEDEDSNEEVIVKIEPVNSEEPTVDKSNPDDHKSTEEYPSAAVKEETQDSLRNSEDTQKDREIPTIPKVETAKEDSKQKLPVTEKVSADKPNSDKPNPDKPNADEPSPDDHKKEEPTVAKEEDSSQKHTCNDSSSSSMEQEKQNDSKQNSKGSSKRKMDSTTSEPPVKSTEDSEQESPIAHEPQMDDDSETQQPDEDEKHDAHVNLEEVPEIQMDKPDSEQIIIEPDVQQKIVKEPEPNVVIKDEQSKSEEPPKTQKESVVPKPIAKRNKEVVPVEEGAKVQRPIHEKIVFRKVHPQVVKPESIGGNSKRTSQIQMKPVLLQKKNKDDPPNPKRPEIIWISLKDKNAVPQKPIDEKIVVKEANPQNVPKPKPKMPKAPPIIWKKVPAVPPLPTRKAPQPAKKTSSSESTDELPNSPKQCDRSGNHKSSSNDKHSSLPFPYPRRARFYYPDDEEPPSIEQKSDPPTPTNGLDKPEKNGSTPLTPAIVPDPAKSTSFAKVAAPFFARQPPKSIPDPFMSSSPNFKKFILGEKIPNFLDKMIGSEKNGTDKPVAKESKKTSSPERESKIIGFGATVTSLPPSELVKKAPSFALGAPKQLRQNPFLVSPAVDGKSGVSVEKQDNSQAVPVAEQPKSKEFDKTSSHRLMSRQFPGEVLDCMYETVKAERQQCLKEYGAAWYAATRESHRKRVAEERERKRRCEAEEEEKWKRAEEEYMRRSREEQLP